MNNSQIISIKEKTAINTFSKIRFGKDVWWLSLTTKKSIERIRKNLSVGELKKFFIHIKCIICPIYENNINKAQSILGKFKILNLQS